jgi:hypothetical protein
MVLENSRYLDGDTAVPLTRGRIQLQSEAAEVYYKDLRIKSLDALPPAYAAYYDCSRGRSGDPSSAAGRAGTFTSLCD